MGCLILAILTSGCVTTYPAYHGTSKTVTHSATATAMELQSMNVEGNKITLISKTPSASALLVCHITELQYSRRNTTQGIIFWEKFHANFDQNGHCALVADLSKAKSNTWYVISVIFQRSGRKYQLKTQIENGNFIELEQL